MKKITLLLSLFILMGSCGLKNTRALLSDGDYDAVINRAIEELRSNKKAKSKQDYVYLAEEAFAKAKERDVREIELLTKEGNPAKLEQIYSTYLKLDNRQERIRPLLPLRLIKERREALFPFDNYSESIMNSKNNLSKYLYDNSKALLLTKDKMSARRAFDDLAYLENINPGYKEVKKLMEEAQFKGTDFISVYTKNETNMTIPTRLQNDLLDFSTFGLNDKWTVYHSTKQKGINYDYELIVNFRQINISPEQVKEKEFIKEKQVKDGLKTVLDTRGNIVKDSLGKPIKVDNFKTIRVNIYEFKQFKSCQITAKVDYIDFNSNQLVDAFPITSEFIFENIYANYNGDKAACEQNYLSNFSKKAVAFPNNEQMIYDTGEDLKAKLKDIITKNRFRR